MTLGEMLKFLIKIIGGLIRRKLSYQHMKRLLQANGLAEKLKKHYEIYPENINEFDTWVKKAQELWDQKKTAIKKLPTVIIEYH